MDADTRTALIRQSRNLDRPVRVYFNKMMCAGSTELELAGVLSRNGCPLPEPDDHGHDHGHGHGHGRGRGRGKGKRT